MTKPTEPQVKPSHTPFEPTWLEVKAYNIHTGQQLNKHKFFVSDIDRIKPDLIIQNEGITFRSLGINEDVVKMLRKHGEAERVWVTKDMKLRQIGFKYRLLKLKYADMLKVKDV